MEHKHRHVGITQFRPHLKPISSDDKKFPTQSVLPLDNRIKQSLFPADMKSMAGQWNEAGQLWMMKYFTVNSIYFYHMNMCIIIYIIFSSGMYLPCVARKITLSVLQQYIHAPLP